MDYMKSQRKIQRNGKKICHAYDQRKNKLERLVKKSDQKRQHRRNIDRPSQTHQSLQHENTVVNLSQKELSTSEVSLLSRGLSFCPRPPPVNRFELRQDFLDFTRRFRLREYFHD